MQTPRLRLAGYSTVVQPLSLPPYDLLIVMETLSSNNCTRASHSHTEAFQGQFQGHRSTGIAAGIGVKRQVYRQRTGRTICARTETSILSIRCPSLSWHLCNNNLPIAYQKSIGLCSRAQAPDKLRRWYHAGGCWQPCCLFSDIPNMVKI